MELFPPDHKFVAVSVTGVTDSEGDPISITFTRVEQDEPPATAGCPDVMGVGTGAIAPPEVVPIINVKRDGNDLLPQVWVRFECAQPFFSRWTTATPLRSEQFDERALRLTALEYCSRGR